MRRRMLASGTYERVTRNHKYTCVEGYLHIAVNDVFPVALPLPGRVRLSEEERATRRQEKERRAVEAQEAAARIAATREQEQQAHIRQEAERVVAVWRERERRNIAEEMERLKNELIHGDEQFHARVQAEMLEAVENTNRRARQELEHEYNAAIAHERVRIANKAQHELMNLQAGIEAENQQLHDEYLDEHVRIMAEERQRLAGEIIEANRQYRENLEAENARILADERQRLARKVEESIDAARAEMEVAQLNFRNQLLAGNGEMMLQERRRLATSAEAGINEARAANEILREKLIMEKKARTIEDRQEGFQVIIGPPFVKDPYGNLEKKNFIANHALNIFFYFLNSRNKRRKRSLGKKR